MTVYWKVVKKILNKEIKPKGAIYFAAGTLCLDGMPHKDTFLGLHINGIACIGLDSECEQPEEITKLVREIYLETKGYTDYYKESVCPQ